MLQIAPMLWSLLPYLPLGLLAGLLSGLLGIGGGLVFSPLLLLMGLDPHQALATSTLAIVPTTCGGTWAHLRSRSLPWRGCLAIALGSALGAALFSHVGFGVQGWLLLTLQALMYGVLAVTIRAHSGLVAPAGASWNWGGLAGVGCVAGLGTGMLGVGGGLVMVPLMVRFLQVPIHLAIRFSTLAVLVSASVASVRFLGDGRGLLPVGLALGATAALAARWSASRLDRVGDGALVWMLRALTVLLALDSGRRALALVLWPASPGL
ncbi:sulfite exporter TauE/SafE family protein [Cyanobium sp. T1B-Tous]|uniref:sulfite exporter TauE/SafE family protein n=1 Tax=Cyanobium sp. T1B-Tous TaxID=2823721 RepID=UPI0028F3E630|nr:sulfite exporter TauE/SafE family protein [Cyanobium sp. T1B-Tous]